MWNFYILGFKPGCPKSMHFDIDISFVLSLRKKVYKQLENYRVARMLHWERRGKWVSCIFVKDERRVREKNKRQVLRYESCLGSRQELDCKVLGCETRSLMFLFCPCSAERLWVSRRILPLP